RSNMSFSPDLDELEIVFQQCRKLVQIPLPDVKGVGDSLAARLVDRPVGSGNDEGSIFAEHSPDFAEILLGVGQMFDQFEGGDNIESLREKRKILAVAGQVKRVLRGMMAARVADRRKVIVNAHHQARQAGQVNAAVACAAAGVQDLPPGTKRTRVFIPDKMFVE